MKPRRKKASKVPTKRDRPLAKKAVQERARFTIQAILEATTTCLERDGIAKFSTTTVAARAGVSVGTLYQYFPDREALMGALVEQIASQEDRLVAEALAGARDLGDAIRRVVSAYFEAVNANLPLFLPLFEALYTICPKEDLRRFESAGVRRLKELLKKFGSPREDLERAAFLVSYSFIGMLRFCASNRPEYLREPKFRAELIEMIAAYAVG